MGYFVILEHLLLGSDCTVYDMLFLCAIIDWFGSEHYYITQG
jgi:hypothetical protein